MECGRRQMCLLVVLGKAGGSVGHFPSDCVSRIYLVRDFTALRALHVPLGYRLVVPACIRETPTVRQRKALFFFNLFVSSGGHTWCCLRVAPDSMYLMPSQQGYCSVLRTALSASELQAPCVPLLVPFWLQIRHL